MAYFLKMKNLLIYVVKMKNGRFYENTYYFLYDFTHSIEIELIKNLHLRIMSDLENQTY